MRWNLAVPIFGNSMGNFRVQRRSKKRRLGKDLIHRSAPQTCLADFRIALRYHLDQSNSRFPLFGNEQSLSEKIMTWFSKTTKRSQTSLPSPTFPACPWLR